MKNFGGPAICLDRNDINTDEIIPAKYLTENSKEALKPYMLEDLKLPGFDPASEQLRRAKVIITRANFGCGSSREHAVWVFEVNDINVVIGESFARIFRQNMFNCGMLAVELKKEEIDRIFALGDDLQIAVDLGANKVKANSAKGEAAFSFELNPFDRELVLAGGWLPYADQKY
ncbi:MAG TPA: 3-isopropylmalate dehydratase small subunit [Desulfurivibrionaceae bacterium]|nr:3-isopropylmalate dehydratase small subunit [Desulfurivibrionaceae bacterium]